MKINGNDRCPHCGHRHLVMKMFAMPVDGWDCRGCGRKLKDSMKRRMVASMAMSAVGIFLVPRIEPMGLAIFVALFVWIPLGIGMFQIALDIRASD